MDDRKLSVAAAIDAWDLTPVAARMMKRHGWTSAKTELIERKYRKFMGDASATEPPPAVDVFWHEHIIDTRDYASFCERVFGRFIDHIPSEHGCACSNCDKAPSVL